MRRSLLVLLGIAVLLAVHMTADYVEGRRLANAVVRVPDVFKADRPRPHLPFAQDAYPFYEAAAILAAADIERILIVGHRLESAIGTGIDADLRTQARASILQSAAWPLIEQGQQRTLRPGAPNDLFEFLNLDALLGARTLYAALDGDASAAAAMSLVDLQIDDRVASSRLPWASVGAPLSRLQVVLNHTQPTLQDLNRLAPALAAMDRDDILTWAFAQDLRDDLDLHLQQLGGSYASVGRVGLFGATWASIGVRAIRPYLAAQLKSRLDHFSAVKDALGAPWPNRIEAVPLELRSIRSGDESSVVVRTVARLAVIRAARVAVAVESYRRANNGALPHDLNALVPTYLDRIPIDPFSGSQMRFVTPGVGYAVYSVGPNRKDDGGRFTGLEVFARPLITGIEHGWPSNSLDIGIRITK